jgi:hypothetical protein
MTCSVSKRNHAREQRYPQTPTPLMMIMNQGPTSSLKTSANLISPLVVYLMMRKKRMQLPLAYPMSHSLRLASPYPYRRLYIPWQLLHRLKSRKHAFQSSYWVGVSESYRVIALIILETGRDCIGNAKTGSGKTIAFAIPILQRLSEDPCGLFALVLTPTRYALIVVLSVYPHQRNPLKRTRFPNYRTICRAGFVFEPQDCSSCWRNGYDRASPGARKQTARNYCHSWPARGPS